MGGLDDSPPCSWRRVSASGPAAPPVSELIYDPVHREPAYPPHPERPLLFLDYDGTLAPIVDDPSAAHPHPEVPDLLPALAERFPLYVITGRHLEGLASLLDRPLPAVGLHGTQEGTLGGEVSATIPEVALEALDRLRASVPEVEGVRVEPKGPSFAVHYRGAPDEEAARVALEAWADGVPEGLAVIHGKKVVELRPEGHSKGVAVARLARRHPEHTPVYLGDDVTDEDAFRALPEPAVTVKVGEGTSAARYRLLDVESVIAYLKTFLRP
jgi:trehalose 6-phosphate phosphatase